MRGVPCVIPGTLEIEGRKKASELISEVIWNSRAGDGSVASMADTLGTLCLPCSGRCRLSCHLLPSAILIGVSIQTM